MIVREKMAKKEEMNRLKKESQNEEGMTKKRSTIKRAAGD
jgi:hypothetical protein